MENFVTDCRAHGIAVESASAEGRSYAGILQLADALDADLIALGADGLGATGNGLLGGTTTRVLNSAPCDLLIARRSPGSGPILTGIDGGQAALTAADMAVALGRLLKRPVHMTAVYDPDFHTHVFGVMAQSLSPETQEQIGLEGQEELHDDIINDGLRKLYDEFLHEAHQRCSSDHVQLTRSLRTGKPYCALAAAAEEMNADLVVVGRHGHHRQPYSRLGSNAECLIRTTAANVLLVGGVDEKIPDSKSAIHIEETDDPGSSLTWEPDAQARLKRVPSFVRMMAKRAVESAVRQSGRSSVSADDFDAVAAKFGMGPKKGGK
jgi:nucleotide-binding universal stress UspA family protein